MPTTVPKITAAFMLSCLIVVAIALGVTERMRATEVTGTTQQLLVAKSASGSVASVGAGFMPRCRETAVYIQWSAGTSGGGITVESAHDVNYTGTWAPLSVVAWSAASKEDIVQITGIHSAIQTRISTILSGGTANTWIVCN